MMPITYTRITSLPGRYAICSRCNAVIPLGHYSDPYKDRYTVKHTAFHERIDLLLGDDNPWD